MKEFAEVLYLAKCRTTGCWEHGSARRSDGHVDVKHSTLARNGFSADPEQSFAAGWSASFDGTVAVAGIKLKVVLSENSSIEGTVDLCLVEGEYFLKARLNASLSDMPPEVARMLAGVVHRRGSHSKAISGNIDVLIDAI